MKLLHRYLTLAVVGFSTVVQAENTLTGSDVTYTGQSVAVRACRAVVEDDPRKLNRVLRDIRRDAVWGYTFKLRSEAIAGSVTCNKLALHDFAEEIGAWRVSNYLDRGIVNIEEMVTLEEP